MTAVASTAIVIHRHANLGRLKINVFPMVDVAGILMTAAASTAIAIHHAARPGRLKMRTTERWLKELMPKFRNGLELYIL